MKTIKVVGKVIKGSGVIDISNGRPVGYLTRASVASQNRRNGVSCDLCVLVDGQWYWVPGKRAQSRLNYAPVEFRGVPVPARCVLIGSGS